MNARTSHNDLATILRESSSSNRRLHDVRDVLPGNDISSARSVEELLQLAGLNWKANMAKVQYNPVLAGDDPNDKRIVAPFEVADRRVIYRDDTGLDLGVNSDHYKSFQPLDAATFFMDVCERHGFQLERGCAFKGGKVIFLRAQVGKALRIHGNDVVQGELSFVTSFDGSLASTFRFGTLRQICLNGLTVGADIVPVVRVAHRSIVDTANVKIKLGLEGVFEKFEEQATIMADTQVNNRQAIEFFMAVYHDMKAQELVEAQVSAQKLAQRVDETIARLAQHFIASPGSQLSSAKNTVWGLVNAVTYDVDHVINARSNENRAFSALFGQGEKLKNKAWDLAREFARAA